MIHSGALGDFVMSLRLAEAIRRSGARHITFVGRGAYRGLADGCEFINAYRDIDTGGFHLLFSPEGEIPGVVREAFGGVELVLNLLGGTPATRKSLHEIGVGRVVEIDTRPRPDWRGHISEQWLNDLEAQSVRGWAGPPVLRFNHRNFTGSAEVTPGPRRKAILHPGSGAQWKCWPLDRFLALSESLAAEGWDVGFMLGPVESERFGGEERSQLEHRGPVFLGEDLCAAAGRMADARLFVGNDSGATHLAAAVGACVVAIFGPTQPELWRPLGSRVAVVSGGRPWPSVAEVRRVVQQITSFDAVSPRA